VILENEEVIIENALVKRNFKIIYMGVEKTLSHYQILSWNDHSYPEAEQGYAILDFLITQINNNVQNYNTPVLVHCR
jgi:protein tyrosine phosphatase